MKYELTRGQGNTSYNAIISIAKKTINADAGYQLANLEELLLANSKGVRRGRRDIMKKFSSPVLDQEGKPTSNVEIPIGKVEEFQDAMDEFLDAPMEPFEFTPIKRDLLTKAKGTEELTQEFWSKCLRFIAQTKDAETNK